MSQLGRPSLISPCVFLAIILMIQQSSSAQVQSLTGYPPFATILSGPDDINPNNLNVHLNVPIAHRTGKTVPFDYALSYDSTIWSISGGKWTPPLRWGWRGVTEAFAGYLSTQQVMCQPVSTCGGDYYWDQNWAYEDAQGTTHDFYASTWGAAWPCSSSSICPTTVTGTTNDGSGMTLTATMNSSGNITSYSLYDKSGTQIVVPISVNGTDATNGTSEVYLSQDEYNWIQATVNGNTTTIGDPAGTLLTVNTSGTKPLSYQYTGPNSTTQTFTLNYSNYYVATSFGCTGVTDYPRTLVSLISSISLPDGSSYGFNYEYNSSTGNYTGRISQITLPTGGKISYTYTGGNQGLDCADGTAAGLTRATPDGSWTYTRSDPTKLSTGNVSTTVLDPGNNTTVFSFSNGYQTQRQIYQGSVSSTACSSTVTSNCIISTTMTCYNGYFSNCASPSDGNGITSPTRKDVYFTPGGSTKSSLSETFYNIAGLLTQDNEYDYGINTGAAPTGTPLKSTVITYATLTDQYVLDRPACMQVYSGSSTGTCGNLTNNTKSLTTYTNYGGTGLGWNVGTITSLAGGTCQIPKGTGCIKGTYTYLSRSFTYNAGSEIVTATDVNGAQTTYSYTTCPGGSDGGLLTGISEPLSLSQSFTEDCNGRVVTSVTDENGQITQYGYGSDPFWRILSITDPLENVIQNTYTVANGTTGAQQESAMTFTSPGSSNSSIADVLATADSLGRAVFVQKKQAPGSTTFDSVQMTYAYNATGFITTRSMPYSGTAVQTAPTGTPVTTSQLDSAGRTLSTTDGGGGTVTNGYTLNDVLRTLGPAPTGEKTKQRQTEYDALGRVTSSCEISSTLAGTTTCSQAAGSNTGYFVTYTYDNPLNALTVKETANGTTQTRTYQYDPLGRMISEANSESSTTTYTYDSDSSNTCAGTYNGDLVKSVDNAGNVTCYTYDALHRPLSVTHPSGPNAANTANKCFVYDAAIDGQTVTFTKTRLAEAYTTTSACSTTTLPTFKTDEAFGYSARGEGTDLYQKSPNSGSYYHTTAGFAANGAVNALSGVPGLNSWTYGLDREGRTTSTTYGATTNWVISTTYNTSSQATNIAYGNGDSDTYTYDGNTGRMTGFQFTVGAVPKSLVGTIGPTGWNANGTMKSLSITDPLNTGDTQNCTYTHDDLSRLASVNCVNGSTNVWNQNFTPDGFGNLSKSVPSGGAGSSFLPTYNEATNEFTLPGCSATYDGDGNLTNDCTNSYSWDAISNAISINSVTVTYDALDREVETSTGSTTTQILYTPLGKLGVMNGQNPSAIRIPLPGGSLAESLSGGSVRILHSDWQGSVRLSTDYTNRTMVCDTAYAPYGEAYATTGTCTTDLSYTGHFQDTVPGLYDFQDRKYSPVQGRWVQPDPLGLGAVDPMNTQSWNRYAAVLNQPLELVDPLGDCPNAANPGDATGGDCGGVGYWSETGCIMVRYIVNNGVDDPYPVTGTYSCGGGGSGPGGVNSGSGGGANNAKKQTFTQCMAANSSTFSLAGLAQGAFNTVLGQFGTSVDFQDKWWAKLLGGNMISGTLFGAADDAGYAAVGASPPLLKTAMGTGITWGRNTSTITALNIARKGGLPRALSSATGGVKSFLGAADDVLTLGMSFTTRLEVDAALAAAEAAYCVYKTR